VTHPKEVDVTTAATTTVRRLQRTLAIQVAINAFGLLLYGVFVVYDDVPAARAIEAGWIAYFAVQVYRRYTAWRGARDLANALARATDPATGHLDPDRLADLLTAGGRR
jgi:hypothetical protein